MPSPRSNSQIAFSTFECLRTPWKLGSNFLNKAIKEGIESYKRAKDIIKDAAGETDTEYDIANVIAGLERDMEEAARNLQFERAIVLRDQIERLRKKIK